MYPRSNKEEIASVTGCGGYHPNSQGWSQGRRPVINVNWHDAKLYVSWLSRKTRKQYRLLSEAEWEYMARAGSTTQYPWGDAVGSGKANCKGCGSQWGGRQTAPVGRFKANNFGIYDAIGNVFEWVEDCYIDSYRSAPTDAEARVTKSKCSRVFRGGSWFFEPWSVRSAYRGAAGISARLKYVGFRVARTLPQ